MNSILLEPFPICVTLRKCTTQPAVTMKKVVCRDTVTLPEMTLGTNALALGTTKILSNNMVQSAEIVRRRGCSKELMVEKLSVEPTDFQMGDRDVLAEMGVRRSRKWSAGDST